MHWNRWNYTIEHRISEYKEKNINAAFEEGIQNEKILLYTEYLNIKRKI